MICSAQVFRRVAETGLNWDAGVCSLCLLHETEQPTVLHRDVSSAITASCKDRGGRLHVQGSRRPHHAQAQTVLNCSYCTALDFLLPDGITPQHDLPLSAMTHSGDYVHTMAPTYHGSSDRELPAVCWSRV